MDLIVRNAQLPERPGGEHVDIGVAGGRIVAIAPRLAADAPVHDARGCLTCAGLVETHIHLDKSRLLGRCPAEPGRAINPVRYVEDFKADISESDVYERAEATLRECVLHGTTRIRTHVEVDPTIGLRGYEALHRLARDYAWAVGSAALCLSAGRPDQRAGNRRAAGRGAPAMARR